MPQEDDFHLATEVFSSSHTKTSVIKRCSVHARRTTTAQSPTATRMLILYKLTIHR